MTIKNAKCLELLIDNIYYGSNITNEIRTDFDSNEDFLSSVNVLKTELLINIIINYQNVNIKQENIDIPLSMYENLLTCFKNRDYVLNNDGSVTLSLGGATMHLSQEWLNKLSDILKKSLYQKVYLYNKKQENDIVDENSLVNYLYHTKTFLVESTDGVDDSKIDKIFNENRVKTDRKLEKKKDVKVDQIISTFLRNTKNTINFSITKFKIPSTTFIIKKVNKLGINFYKLPLYKQKILICEWLLEYINCNNLNNEMTKSYLNTLLSIKEDENEYTKQHLIPGLFSIYISLLSSMEIDYSNLSLFEFRIKTYLSPELQNHLKELQVLIKQINGIQEKGLKEQINAVKNELKQINVKDSEILIAKNNELSELLNELKNDGSIKEKLQKRNSLQNIIHYEQETCLSDIAFDNDRIMELIIEASQNGRVYINPLDKNKLIIELYNKELGRVTFQAEIGIEKVVEFISNNNCLLEDTVPSYR